MWQPLQYFTHPIILLVIVGHQSDTKHKLLSIVIVEDTVQILTKVRANLLSYLLHGQLLVGHSLAVQFKTKQPWRDTCCVKVRHFIVDIDKFLVLSDNSVLWVGVIVDGCVGRDLA